MWHLGLGMDVVPKVHNLSFADSSSLTTKLSRGQAAQRIGRRLERRVRRQFGVPTPRSRQIFRARISTISACRGIADLRFRTRLCHHECLPPSRRSSQPLSRRCLSSCRRFIRRPALPHTRDRLPPSPGPPIEFQSLSKRHPQGLQQFLACGFLAIYSGDLFNPAEPPVSFLFHNCGVLHHSFFLLVMVTPNDQAQPRTSREADWPSAGAPGYASCRARSGKRSGWRMVSIPRSTSRSGQ